MAFEIAARNPKDFNNRLLSLKENEKLCDASLIVNGEKFAVHSNILAASSEYFNSIFTESTLKEITFKDVDTKSMQSVLEFCYTGSTKITMENVQEMLMLASVLSLPAIVEACSKILTKDVNFDNPLSIWKNARYTNSENLKQTALSLIKKNFNKISTSKEFLDLEYGELDELLNSGTISDSEEIIYNAIKNWIQHDETARKENLLNLLNRVKLSNLPLGIILSDASSLCNSNKECYEKVIAEVKRRTDSLKIEKSDVCSEKNQSKEELSKIVDSNAAQKSKTTDAVNPIEHKQTVDSSHKEVIKGSSDKKTLVAVGSNKYEKSSILEVYDDAKKQWFDIGISCYKIRYAAVLFDDKIMLIGGEIWNGAQNTVQCYDFKSGLMTTYPSMRYERRWLAAVVHNKSVFAIGGKNNYELLSSVERFDSGAKSWSEVAPMSIGRRLFGAALLGQDVYVVGGFSTSYPLSSTEAYSITNNSWRSCASLNYERCEHGVAAIRGYIYAVGGWRHHETLNSIEKYDSTIDKWSVMDQIIDPGRHDLAMTTFMGNLVIAGGQAGKALSWVDTYKFDEKKWITMPPLVYTRACFNLIEVPWSLVEQALRNMSK